MTGRKVLVITIVAFASMYFIPQVWYVILALLMLFVVLLLVLAMVAFMAKAFGLAALEGWAVYHLMGRRRRANDKADRG